MIHENVLHMGPRLDVVQENQMPASAAVSSKILYCEEMSFSSR